MIHYSLEWNLHVPRILRNRISMIPGFSWVGSPHGSNMLWNTFCLMCSALLQLLNSPRLFFSFPARNSANLLLACLLPLLPPSFLIPVKRRHFLPRKIDFEIFFPCAVKFNTFVLLFHSKLSCRNQCHLQIPSCCTPATSLLMRSILSQISFLLKSISSATFLVLKSRQLLLNRINFFWTVCNFLIAGIHFFSFLLKLQCFLRAINHSLYFFYFNHFLHFLASTFLKIIFAVLIFLFSLQYVINAVSISCSLVCNSFFSSIIPSLNKYFLLSSTSMYCLIPLLPFLGHNLSNFYPLMLIRV